MLNAQAKQMISLGIAGIGLVMLARVTTSVQAQCDSDYTQLDVLTRTCAAASPDSACTLDGQILSLDDIAQTDASLFIRFGSAANDVLDMIVFGRFRLTDSALIESLKIDVRNRTGYNVNLRSGPGTNFDEVGVFRFDAVYPADGRNDDGTWLRITRNEQTAWIRADLVASVDTGNIMDLPVVSSAQGVLPRWRITLTEGRSNCSDELAGALLMADGAAQSIMLNDIPITVEGALLVLPRDDNLIFYGMTGTASVGGETVSPGTTIAMLPIDDPIMAIAFPPFNLIAALPIAPDVCLVGSDIPLRTYARPDTDSMAESVSGDVVSLPISNYAMIGGERWWLAAEHVGWIAADTAETTDACMNVSEIDPPALETTGPSQPPTTVPFAGLSPEEIVIDYLEARVAGDTRQMQQLACDAWDSQTALQAQSFRAMRAQLKDVQCTANASSAATTTVQCSGYIETQYNDQIRQWPLGLYQMTREGGAWRICGEG